MQRKNTFYEKQLNFLTIVAKCKIINKLKEIKKKKKCPSLLNCPH